jgi:hypothetical protein
VPHVERGRRSRKTPPFANEPRSDALHDGTLSNVAIGQLDCSTVFHAPRFDATFPELSTSRAHLLNLIGD